MLALQDEAPNFGSSRRVCSCFLPAVGAEQAAAQDLPRTPLLEQAPTVAPYNPPALSNPSERVLQSESPFH